MSPSTIKSLIEGPTDTWPKWLVVMVRLSRYKPSDGELQALWVALKDEASLTKTEINTLDGMAHSAAINPLLHPALRR